MLHRFKLILTMVQFEHFSKSSFNTLQNFHNKSYSIIKINKIICTHFYPKNEKTSSGMNFLHQLLTFFIRKFLCSLLIGAARASWTNQKCSTRAGCIAGCHYIRSLISTTWYWARRRQSEPFLMVGTSSVPSIPICKFRSFIAL